jgi:hypothetical protein
MYISSGRKVIDELKSMEPAVAWSRCYPDIWLEGLKEVTGTVSQGSRSPAQDSNWELFFDQFVRWNSVLDESESVFSATQFKWLPMFISKLRQLLLASLLLLLLLLLMVLQPFHWSLASLFSFLTLYTVGRTPWTGDQPVLMPLSTHRTTQTE